VRDARDPNQVLSRMAEHEKTIFHSLWDRVNIIATDFKRRSSLGVFAKCSGLIASSIDLKM
jgi:hypothetical protein